MILLGFLPVFWRKFDDISAGSTLVIGPPSAGGVAFDAVKELAMIHSQPREPGRLQAVADHPDAFLIVGEGLVAEKALLAEA